MVDVFIHPALPYNATYEACDIETKDVIKIYSEDIIDAFIIGDKMYVSQDRFNQLKENFYHNGSTF